MKDKANVKLMAALLAVLLLAVTVMPSAVWAKDRDTTEADAEKYLTAVVDEAALQEKADASKEEFISVKSSFKAAKSGDFTFKTSGSKATITGYTGNKTSVSIPSKLGSYTVVAIGKEAFASNYTLQSVSIPKTVTDIQYGAFMWVGSLSKVTFAKGSKLSSIAKLAFAGTGIKKLTLPDGTKTIGEQAFNGCSSLKSISLGKKLKSIGDSAFCYSGLTSVKMPNTVTKIGSYCFYEAASLKSVTLSTALTAIPDGAFQYSGLTALKIPGKVKTIGIDAFNSTKIQSLSIPSNVQAIGSGAFASCKKLSKLTIGSKVTSIPYSAFAACNLTDVTLGKNTKSIGQEAFRKNKNLKKINLPATVTAIEYRAFSDCKKLSDINLPENPTKIGGKALDNTAWLANQKGVIYIGSFLYGDASDSSSIEIKEGTTAICDFAFDGQTALTSVTIPEGVTTIGEGAFFGTGLTSITIPSSVTDIKPLAIGYKKFKLEKSEKDFEEWDEYNAYRDEQYKARKVKEYGMWNDYDIVTSYCYGSAEPVADFTIIGKAGSAAEKYAKENGFQFTAN